MGFKGLVYNLKRLGVKVEDAWSIGLRGLEYIL